MRQPFCITVLFFSVLTTSQLALAQGLFSIPRNAASRAMGRSTYGMTYDRDGRPGVWSGNSIYRNWRPLFQDRSGSRHYTYRNPTGSDSTQWGPAERFPRDNRVGATSMPVPSLGDVSTMSREDLEAVLRTGSTNLRNRLSRNAEKGTGWIRYLKLDRLDEHLATADALPTVDNGFATLTDVLRRFDKTREEDRYRPVSASSAFRTTHMALSHYVKSSRTPRFAAPSDSQPRLHPPVLLGAANGE